VVLASVHPGNAGHVDGAVTMVSLNALSVIMAATRAVIAQW
jgi:hypothetical protein